MPAAVCDVQHSGFTTGGSSDESPERPSPQTLPFVRRKRSRSSRPSRTPRPRLAVPSPPRRRRATWCRRPHAAVAAREPREARLRGSKVLIQNRLEHRDGIPVRRRPRRRQPGGDPTRLAPPRHTRPRHFASCDAAPRKGARPPGTGSQLRAGGAAVAGHRPSVHRDSHPGPYDGPASDRGTHGDVAADAADHGHAPGLTEAPRRETVRSPLRPTRRGAIRYEAGLPGIGPDHRVGSDRRGTRRVGGVADR